MDMDIDRVAPAAPPTAVPFELSDVQETDKEYEKAQGLMATYRLVFSAEDVVQSIRQFENTATYCGVKSQYFKRQALIQILPADVSRGAAPESDKSSEEAAAEGPTPYKALKDKILQVFGPDPALLFQRISEVRRTGTPSEFLARLMRVVDSDLQCDKCRHLVYSAWLHGLPPTVQTALAQRELLTAENRAELSRLADTVYRLDPPVLPEAPPAAPAVPHRPVPPVLPEAPPAAPAVQAPEPQPPQPVAQPGEQDQPAQDVAALPVAGQEAVPDSPSVRAKKRRLDWDEGRGVCGEHARCGVNARFCSEPDRCPLAELIVPE